MAGYKEAFQKIRGDSNLAKKFVNDPKGTLADLGVDTSNLSSTKATPSRAGVSGVCVGCGLCIG